MHLEASSGIEKSGNNITSWTSKTNKNGNSYKLTSNNPAHVTYNIKNSDANDQPSISLNGSGYLANTNFPEMAGLNDFTRIVIAKTDPTIYRGPVAWDNSTGYEGWIESSYLYSRSSMGSGYLRVTQPHNDIEPYSPFISTSRFDYSETNNKDRLELRFNKTVIPQDTIYYYSNLGKPGTGSNIHLNIGSYKNGYGNYNFKGEVFEVMYFDRKLKDVEINYLETQLLAKYGLKTLCYEPDAVPAGHILEDCGTSGNNPKLEKECKVKCDTENGFAHEGEISVSCPASGGKFIISGCHNYSTPGLALSRNALHLEANSGITTAAGGQKVLTWESKPDADGNKITLSRKSYSGPSVETIKGQKYLHFAGNNNSEVLTTNEFDAIKGR